MDAESAAREASPAGVDDGQHDETKEVVAGEDSDLESIISEIDEKELEEYDVDAAQLESRAVQIDEDIARSLKARKRTDGDGGQPRRPRERRREKRNRDEDTTTGGDGDAKRRRRNAGAGRGAGGRGAGGRGEKAGPPPDKDEDLTPDERRRRALAKAMDLAMKNNVKRRKKKDEVVGCVPVCGENAHILRGGAEPVPHQPLLLGELTGLSVWRRTSKTPSTNNLLT